MTVFYLDTSALVKRYLVEQGTAWIRTQVDAQARNTIIIGEMTIVEVGSALASRQRGGFITLAARDAALDLFLHHADTEYTLVPIERTMIDRALLLTQSYRLRAYDAMQLATALVVADVYRGAAVPLPTLVAADDAMLLAAQAEGLNTANPNHY